MKKQFLFVVLFGLTINVFGQQTSPSPAYTKSYNLQKSKHQNTAAWFLLVGGASLLTTGLAINKGDLIKEYFIGRSDYKNDGIKSAFEGTGFALMTGSITLFIASIRNKEKAMSASASLKMEKFTAVQQQSLVQSSYPALSLKIKL